jgi:hypothetical protein
MSTDRELRSLYSFKNIFKLGNSQGFFRQSSILDTLIPMFIFSIGFISRQITSRSNEDKQINLNLRIFNFLSMWGFGNWVIICKVINYINEIMLCIYIFKKCIYTTLFR